MNTEISLGNRVTVEQDAAIYLKASKIISLFMALSSQDFDRVFSCEFVSEIKQRPRSGIALGLNKGTLLMRLPESFDLVRGKVFRDGVGSTHFRRIRLPQRQLNEITELLQLLGQPRCFFEVLDASVMRKTLQKELGAGYEVKISGDFFHFLYGQLNYGVMRAALVSGKYHPLCRSTVAYASIKSEEVQLGANAYMEKILGKQKFPAPDRDSPDRVGCVHVAKLSSVQAFVERIRPNKSGPIEEYGEEAWFKHWDKNVWSLAFLLMAIIGHRGTKGFSFEEKFLSSSGEIYIDDKAVFNEYTRINKLPAFVQEQFSTHLKNLNYLRERADFPIPSGYELFLLSENPESVDYTVITPSLIKEKLDTDLPPNFFRATLFAYFHDENIPESAIYQWEGHRKPGVSYQEPYSSLNPKKEFQVISGSIEKYMEEANLKNLRLRRLYA